MPVRLELAEFYDGRIEKRRDGGVDIVNPLRVLILPGPLPPDLRTWQLKRSPVMVVLASDEQRHRIDVDVVVPSGETSTTYSGTEEFQWEDGEFRFAADIKVQSEHPLSPGILRVPIRVDGQVVGEAQVEIRFEA